MQLFGKLWACLFKLKTYLDKSRGDVDTWWYNSLKAAIVHDEITNWNNE